MIKKFEEFDADIFKKRDNEICDVLIRKIENNELNVRYSGNPSSGRYIYTVTENNNDDDNNIPIDHTDIDPYGEEIWDEENIPSTFEIWLEKGLQNGSQISLHYDGKQLVVAESSFVRRNYKYHKLKNLLKKSDNIPGYANIKSGPYDSVINKQTARQDLGYVLD